jgi:glutathione peroxidase
VTYSQLTELHRRLRPRGFEILAFPTNDFRQEPGSNEEIREFVEQHFHSQFPIMAKIHVNGPHTDPVYKTLKSMVPGDIPHNFFKFLVDRRGVAVHRYHKKEEPFSFEQDIIKLLDSPQQQ